MVTLVRPVREPEVRRARVVSMREWLWLEGYREMAWLLGEAIEVHGLPAARYWASRALDASVGSDFADGLHHRGVKDAIRDAYGLQTVAP